LHHRRLNGTGNGKKKSSCFAEPYHSNPTKSETSKTRNWQFGRASWPISWFVLFSYFSLVTEKMASFAEDQEEYDNSNDNIWVAASNGDVERVNVLLSSGISVNAQDEYGYSPM
jgi:hypothetical protein